MCYIELQIQELEKEIIYLKQYHLKEKCKWLEEKENLQEIIDEIKSCLYIEENLSISDEELQIFCDT